MIGRRETTGENWFATQSNVDRLAHWLVDNDRLGETKDEALRNLLYYFSKPWKWTPEWDEFQRQSTVAG